MYIDQPGLRHYCEAEQLPCIVEVGAVVAMMARVRCMLLLLLLVASCLAGSAMADDANSEVDNSQSSFDYFYLVRQWPATFCNEHACTHRPPRKFRFTVHGLWPERRDGTWPQFCAPGDDLNVEEIADLVPEMERVWPSWSSDDEAFWNHEWARHGTCAMSTIRGHQHRFFETVLRLHEQLNIQDALADAGIMPSNSVTYKAQEIKDAIEAAYGVMPHITCDNRGELAEVWMCISKKLRPIDCVEDPQPRASAVTTASGVTSTAPAGTNMPNFACSDVRIPKLSTKHAGEQHNGNDDTYDDDDDYEHKERGDGQQEQMEVVDIRAAETAVQAAFAVALDVMSGTVASLQTQVVGAAAEVLGSAATALDRAARLADAAAASAAAAAGIPRTAEQTAAAAAAATTEQQSLSKDDRPQQQEQQQVPVVSVEALQSSGVTTSPQQSMPAQEMTVAQPAPPQAVAAAAPRPRGMGERVLLALGVTTVALAAAALVAAVAMQSYMWLQHSQRHLAGGDYLPLWPVRPGKPSAATRSPTVTACV